MVIFMYYSNTLFNIPSSLYMYPVSYTHLIDLSLHRHETSVDIVMLINVTTKQNTINLMFQTLEKSTDARSLNSKKGKGILNTNLFILFAKSSSKIPTLRRKSPNTIIRKIGPVAFRQNIKFSISN